MKKTGADSFSSLQDSSSFSKLVFSSPSKNTRSSSPGSTPRTAPFVLLVASLLFLLLLWWPIPFYPIHYLSSNDSNDNNNTPLPAFTLIVSLQFRTLAYKQHFLNDLFAPLAKYVEQHEPNTLTYQAMVSEQQEEEEEEDELTVVILERYKNKDRDYLKTHKSSKAFQEFRPKLAAMEKAKQVVVVGHSYSDSGVGFVKS